MRGFDQPVEAGSPGPDGLVPFFAVELRCRADGRPAGYAGPKVWTAALIVPYPPQADAVYNAWHPMYWILGLANRAEYRTPVKIRFAGRKIVRSALVRARIHYSAIRPNQTADLDPGEVWAAMRSGRGTALLGTGPGTGINLQFDPRPDLVPLLDLMRRHCPEDAR